MHGTSCRASTHTLGRYVSPPPVVCTCSRLEPLSSSPELLLLQHHGGAPPPARSCECGGGAPGAAGGRCVSTGAAPAQGRRVAAILAVGDWGRRGQFNQTLVAKQMGVVGQRMDIDFVLTTGDNIYEDGIANTSDPLFKECFTNIYTAQSLQKPWYIVLGNHDYTGNALAQQDPAIRKVDSRYTAIAKSFIVNSGIADFFLIDTTPFIHHYCNNSKFDWRGVAPRDAYIANLLQDLKYALTESKAPWKIVVGHHPISSACGPGNNTELEELLLPVLKSHGADMYVNGHHHCLQRITSRDSPLQLLTSGGGSKAWAGKFKATPDKVEFLYDGQGFMSMRLNKKEAHLAFFDVAGNVLHCWILTK